MSNNNQDLGLGLGLGLVHGENCSNKKKKEEEGHPCSNNNKASYPSLTLGPQEASRSSETTTVSSFSNSSCSIKRERDQELLVPKLLDEENKMNNNNPWKLIDVDVDDESNNNGNPRKKLRLTKQQSALLEESFKHHSTLNPKQKQELSRKLNLRARQVEVWFQNRRARTKLKQTEVECSVLKKCCERLREENKRLQKELQHLKSMTQTGPTTLYLHQHQVPPCPSCETNNNNNSNLHHPRFFKTTYPFTQSSAAC
ncbi:hypothetical protein PIB30_003306 [Stylosanthes scabra]|uniref:Homeobox domain-containing protein n=1 Tax=Stylosanthes scabra TaxID=79078 RepID=A0ABU6S3Y2_9FABA|nr:hypothetical protein [Stylosanthes scabra]